MDIPPNFRAAASFRADPAMLDMVLVQDMDMALGVAETEFVPIISPRSISQPVPQPPPQPPPQSSRHGPLRTTWRVRLVERLVMRHVFVSRAAHIRNGATFPNIRAGLARRAESLAVTHGRSRYNPSTPPWGTAAS